MRRRRGRPTRTPPWSESRRNGLGQPCTKENGLGGGKGRAEGAGTSPPFLSLQGREECGMGGGASLICLRRRRWTREGRNEGRRAWCFAQTMLCWWPPLSPPPFLHSSSSTSRCRSVPYSAPPYPRLISLSLCLRAAPDPPPIRPHLSLRHPWEPRGGASGGATTNDRRQTNGANIHTQPMDRWWCVCCVCVLSVATQELRLE